jgi:FAD synthase
MIIVSPFRFGAGDVRLLQSWAADRDIRVIVVDEVTLYGEQHIQFAHPHSNQQRRPGPGQAVCWARPYSLRRLRCRRAVSWARRLGFPTANFPVDSRLVCPSYGVYATRTQVGDRVL